MTARPRPLSDDPAHIRLPDRGLREPPRPLIVPVFLPHAGCPHRCVFCNQVRITGTAAAAPTTAEIEERIETFIGFARTAGRRIEIAFYGGTFLGQPIPRQSRLLSTAVQFIAEGRAHGIRFSTRPDTISEDTASGLRSFPITAVEIGAQSMDDAVLQASRRGHTAADTIRAVKILRKNGISVGLQIMIGLPEEDEHSRRHTAEAICRLSPDFVRIYPTVVLPGSELEERYRRGTYVPLSLDAAVDHTKRLYRQLEANRIPVIRMGLQSSSALDGDDGVTAGPYHPAFGHLVLTEMVYDDMVRKIEGAIPATGVLHLQVHPDSVSQVQGLKKINLHRLKQRFELQAVVVSANPCLKKREIRFSAEKSGHPGGNGV